MIKEEHFSIRSHRYNEDRFVVTDSLFAVIDGASGLTQEKKSGVGTRASRLAAFVKSALQRYRGEDLGQFLIELSRRAYDAGFDDSVSCGIAAFQICRDSARIYALGDCEVIYRLKDGTVSRFRQTELGELDERAISEMVRYAAQNNITVRAARPHIQDILIKNRARKNTSSGYSVFSPSTVPSFEVKAVQIPLSAIASVYICTDGFVPSFTELGILRDTRELFDTPLSVKDICLEIQKILRQDKDFERFPRFKLFDDITAIRLDICAE